LERKERIVAGAAVALVLYTLTLSLLGPMALAAQRNRTISNAGSVKAVGVGVYWDQACSSSVSSIDWGILEQGSNVSRTVYIRNEGNAVAKLTVTASNWNPSNASSYMSLSWDYGGQTLSVGEVIQVKFTLSVSADITGITNFSFDIVVMANE